MTHLLVLKGVIHSGLLSIPQHDMLILFRFKKLPSQQRRVGKQKERRGRSLKLDSCCQGLMQKPSLKISAVNGTGFLGSSSAGNFNCQWSRSILSLPCWIKHSREAICPINCCHSFDRGLWSERKLVATQRNLAI